MKFSHLHVHTQYSLLDGAASIERLYKKAIADGMPALAISDHGNMFGVFEFVNEAHKHKNDDGSLKVKPIVGCEFYITQNRHQKQFSKENKDPRHHQILLAKNAEGYKNLMKLTSLGYIEGMYSKYPRIDKDLINKYHEGLIATTCCLGALVPQTILKKGETEAENEFKWWLNIFQDDFYVELQRHGIPDQEKVNKVLLKFAKKYKVPVIASNDSHYVDEADANAHDILLCINTGSRQTDEKYSNEDDGVQMKNRRFGFPNNEFFLKTTGEMAKTFTDLPEALDNTNRVIDKIDTLHLGRDILIPHFPIPKEFNNQEEYLEHITWEGARQRYSAITPEIEERLNFELFTIKTMGFAGYFLIVSDFVMEGKRMGVFVGPGRGSAAGSVVAYCIGITNIDPIKYNLLFERFLNPDRKSMPDIDTDFDDEGRQKVLDYVVKKYGKNQVAQIITYGTMAAKMSIKDVARVMDLPLNESNQLTKLVPDRPGISLRNILNPQYKWSKPLLEEFGPDDAKNILELRRVHKEENLRGRVLREAESLEGSVRNTGVHASAVIIAPEDLMELIPLAVAKDSELWLTQIDGSNIESAGVLKMDFLGLKTLSILKTAKALIKKNYGQDIDLDTLPLDDEDTFGIFQRGAANGLFQFESAGMQKYLKELKPDKFEDLIAMNALYRPGPMAYIPEYIERKHGRKDIEYDLPAMEEILKETYGVSVYQEQVMLLSQKLADFTKGDADSLRKAMGKKKRAELDKLKSRFLDGGKANGHPQKTLEKIWTDWEKFAQYAFNKSHSTCYAFIAYQTAWLKAHYPHEFMAAILNHCGSIEKITFFMEECKSMGIKVLGPDINESEKDFTVNKKGEIRFGMNGMKGVGEAAIENIVAEREKNGPYPSIFDLVKRVNQRTVNKRSLESLAYAGAFDCFGEMHRAQYFHMPPGEPMNNLERIIRFGNQYQAQLGSMANTLFGDMHMPEAQPPAIPDCAPWPLIQMLDHEKEVVGMYLSGHPLDNYKFQLRYYGITGIREVNEYKESLRENTSRHFNIAGLVTRSIHRISKKGSPFGIFAVEDYTGAMEFTMWSEDFARYHHLLDEGMTVYLNGYFKQRYDNAPFEFKIGKLMFLESLLAQNTRGVELKMQAEKITPDFIQFFEENLHTHPGKSRLKFCIRDQGNDLQVALSNPYQRFEMNTEMAQYLTEQEEVQVKIDLN